jgi:calcineurin-like phosphoesterase family protein
MAIVIVDVVDTTGTNKEILVGNTFWTSDKHLSHRRIIEICDRRNSSGDPFEDIKEHDEAIINNHNAVVGVKDTVYDLGDVVLGNSAEYVVECLERMNGKIHIFYGNHDKMLRKAFNKGLLNNLISSKKIVLIGSPDPTESVTKRFNINGKEVYAGHYSHRVWNKGHWGTYHLYGHSHGGLPPHGKSFDVGVDTHDLFPWSTDEIFEKMKEMSDEFVIKDQNK